LAEVDANGLALGLNGREPSGAQGEGGPVVTFQPEGSLEETVSNLKEQGVEVPAEISEHPWGRVATFKDSEGNDIQLYALPIRMPETKTSAPPRTTCSADMRYRY
jgi:predicted enzyme related to lactoylglutathione lyase